MSTDTHNVGPMENWVLSWKITTNDDWLMLLHKAREQDALLRESGEALRELAPEDSHAKVYARAHALLAKLEARP